MEKRPSALEFSSRTPRRERAGIDTERRGTGLSLRCFDFCLLTSRRGLDPLTRLVAADENAATIHPLPQGGEGGGHRRQAANCKNPSPLLRWGGAWSLYIFDDRNDATKAQVDRKSLSPRPLGGEGGATPAFSSAGERRVRGSGHWRLAEGRWKNARQRWSFPAKRPVAKGLGSTSSGVARVFHFGVLTFAF